MTEDFLGFEDASERRAARGPALVVGTPMGDCELRTAEALYRRHGGAPVLFTRTEEGVEEWDSSEEAARWQRLLGWPVTPSIEDALAWVANRRAMALAAGWEEMREARAADLAVAQQEQSARALRVSKPGGR
jgi:hypothetical protein